MVFESLPLWDLARASEVSQGWRQLAIALLHRNRVVRKMSHVKHLSAQVEADPSGYLASCIHSLSFNFRRTLEEPPELNDAIVVLREFRKVILKLKNVKYLEWHEEVYFEANVMTYIFQEFAIQCPQIEVLTVYCLAYHPKELKFGEVYIPL